MIFKTFDKASKIIYLEDTLLALQEEFDLPFRVWRGHGKTGRVIKVRKDYFDRQRYGLLLYFDDVKKKGRGTDWVYEKAYNQHFKDLYFVYKRYGVEVKRRMR